MVVWPSNCIHEQILNYILIIANNAIYCQGSIMIISDGEAYR